MTTQRARPGPDPMPSEERTGWVVRVYFTAADRERVYAAAGRAGVGYSEYCRTAVLATLPPPAEEG